MERDRDFLYDPERIHSTTSTNTDLSVPTIALPTIDDGTAVLKRVRTNYRAVRDSTRCSCGYFAFTRSLRMFSSDS